MKSYYVLEGRKRKNYLVTNEEIILGSNKPTKIIELPAWGPIGKLVINDVIDRLDCKKLWSY